MQARLQDRTSFRRIQYASFCSVGAARAEGSEAVEPLVLGDAPRPRWRRAGELHAAHGVNDPRGSPRGERGAATLLVLCERPRRGLHRPHVFLLLLILVGVSIVLDGCEIQGGDAVVCLVEAMVRHGSIWVRLGVRVGVGRKAGDGVIVVGVGVALGVRPGGVDGEGGGGGEVPVLGDRHGGRRGGEKSWSQQAPLRHMVNTRSGFYNPVDFYRIRRQIDKIWNQIWIWPGPNFTHP
jgi:hypothetical protein